MATMVLPVTADLLPTLAHVVAIILTLVALGVSGAIVLASRR